jgi:hypothetical protein
MPRPFFDTKEESTMYALKHMPKSDGRPRYDGKVPHLVGFSSSLYGKLDGQFLEPMISRFKVMIEPWRVELLPVCRRRPQN